MNSVLADNSTYLFITLCDHLQLKWRPTIKDTEPACFQSRAQNNTDCNYRTAVA